MGLNGFNETSFFGVHERALELHARRAALITNNLANVSTPNYLAKDLDLKEILSQDHHLSSRGLSQTHVKHLAFHPECRPLAYSEKYRISGQVTVDGNSVDGHIEHAAYTENALRYLANLAFMGHHLQRMNIVLSGGTR